MVRPDNVGSAEHADVGTIWLDEESVAAVDQLHVPLPEEVPVAAERSVVKTMYAVAGLDTVKDMLWLRTWLPADPHS